MARPLPTSTHSKFLGFDFSFSKLVSVYEKIIKLKFLKDRRSLLLSESGDGLAFQDKKLNWALEPFVYHIRS